MDAVKNSTFVNLGMSIADIERTVNTPKKERCKKHSKVMKLTLKISVGGIGWGGRCGCTFVDGEKCC